MKELQADIDWVSLIIEKRVNNNTFDFSSLLPPPLKAVSVYSKFIIDNKISPIERLMLLLAFIPNIYPLYLLQQFRRHFSPEELVRQFTYEEYISGVVKSETCDAFLPTGLTLLYLAAGDNLENRAQVISKIYNEEFFIVEKKIMYLSNNMIHDPVLTNILILNRKYVISFITNNLKYLSYEAN